MPKRPATRRPALNRTALSLRLHIEELRVEFANCLDRAERRQIEAELRAAHAALAAQRTA